MPSGFNKSDANMLRTAWELSAGLLSFVFALGIGWWVGQWIDARLGTGPWMTIVFVLLGFAAGVLNVYRTISRVMGTGAPKS
jgi:F0F1-type ATP synthase assembly protein I